MSCQRIGFVVVLVALCCVAAPGLTGVAQAAGAVGSKPNLQLKLIDGSTLTSADLQGSMVVLDFWATWCGPCVHEIPHMKQINDKYGPQGLRIVSVSLDDSSAVVKPFVQSHGMSWTHAVDAEQPQKLSNAFGVNSIPRVFIISPQGEVLWTGHPMMIDDPLAKAMRDHPPLPPIDTRISDASKKIQQAIEGVDRKQDFDAAWSVVSGLDDKVMAIPSIKTSLHQLLMRFRPVGRRAEAAKKFLADHPDAKSKIEAMGVSLAVAGSSASSASSSSSAAGPASHEDAIAARLLKLADALREQHHDVQAYGKYKLIAQHHPATDAGQAAAERVNAYEADDQFMAKVRKAGQDEQARADFSLAAGYAQAGKTDLAKAGYEKVIKAYPDSDWATKARSALAALN